MHMHTHTHTHTPHTHIHTHTHSPTLTHSQGVQLHIHLIHKYTHLFWLEGDWIDSGHSAMKLASNWLEIVIIQQIPFICNLKACVMLRVFFFRFQFCFVVRLSYACVRALVVSVCACLFFVCFSGLQTQTTHPCILPLPKIQKRSCPNRHDYCKCNRCFVVKDMRPL